MAEYVFVPTGARVTSDAELAAPLFRRADAGGGKDAPPARKAAPTGKAPARRRAPARKG